MELASPETAIVWENFKNNKTREEYSAAVNGHVLEKIRHAQSVQ